MAVRSLPPTTTTTGTTGGKPPPKDLADATTTAGGLPPAKQQKAEIFLDYLKENAMDMFMGGQGQNFFAGFNDETLKKHGAKFGLTGDDVLLLAGRQPGPNAAADAANVRAVQSGQGRV